MSGAKSLIDTAVQGGVSVCFANPGTTEMDLVAALDATPGMRSVLGLFEGVCTGMADGFGRMTGRPALTLLHLGVGLSNGMANIHNARRAGSPMINIVGDHPAEHLPYDAPLTSDIAAMAGPVSHWVETIGTAHSAGRCMAEAIRIATGPPGNIVTMIAASDTMRDEAPESIPVVVENPRAEADEGRVYQAADALRSGEPVVLLGGGSALHAEGLEFGARIASVSGCRFMCTGFPARLERGAGLPAVERMPYFPEAIIERLAGVKHLILAGAKAPVSFFKYAEYPSDLVPEGCEVIPLCGDDEDPLAALDALADEVKAPKDAPLAELKIPDAPSGDLNSKSLGAAVAASLPEGAIIADESATSGGPAYFLTQTARAHTSMYLTGGGIGWGLPVATGAAVACPERPVLALQGDGGAMYTIQALWTQAREGLNVTNVILSNRKYQILQVEQARTGLTNPGEVARGLTELTNPDLDFCAMAKSMRVPATRPESAEELHNDLQRAYEEPGPHVIEVVL